MYRIHKKQSECKLPLPTLLTSADGRTVADDVRQLKTCAVGSIVADDVRQQTLASHAYNHSEFMLSWPTLLRSADGRIVVHDVRQQIIVSPL